MKALPFFKMLQPIHLKTQHYSREYLIPQQHCHQNLKSHTHEQQKINYASHTAKVLKSTDETAGTPNTRRHTRILQII
jgi:hypothetical protein